MTQRNFQMAMRSPDTTLNMACRRCGHTARWGRKQALLTFSQWAPPFQVRDRLKCGQCGEKNRITVTI